MEAGYSKQLDEAVAIATTQFDDWGTARDVASRYVRARRAGESHRQTARKIRKQCGSLWASLALQVVLFLLKRWWERRHSK